MKAVKNKVGWVLVGIVALMGKQSFARDGYESEGGGSGIGNYGTGQLAGYSPATAFADEFADRAQGDGQRRHRN